MSETKEMELKGAEAELGVLRDITNLINSPDFQDDDAPSIKVRPPSEEIAAGVGAPSRAFKEAMANVDKADATAAAAAAAAAAPIAPGPVAQVAAVVGKRELPARVFTTGRLKSGKDHILTSLNYTIRGFAEPLYALQKQFFGTADKNVPGARQFLQTVGQWGRGVINARYPISAGRVVFTTMIRTMGKTSGVLPTGFEVEWAKYGADPALWLSACLRRVDRERLPVPSRVAISNVRFANEFETLRAAGWAGFHIMCSPETLAKRLKESGLAMNSPQVNDTSEELAIMMDRDALGQAKKKPMGTKMRVIWNDPFVKCPSNRFYTLDELR